MRPLTLKLNENPRGSNPVDGLYKAIKRQYPTLGLTRKNSVIGNIQAWPTQYEPYRTYMKIIKKGSPNQAEEFFFHRFDISLYINNPIFSKTEAKALEPKTGHEVLNAVAAKLNLNLTPDDFWVEAYPFTSTGGEVSPNFRLQTRYNSPYWCGSTIVWLHQ